MCGNNSPKSSLGGGFHEGYISVQQSTMIPLIHMLQCRNPQTMGTKEYLQEDKVGCPLSHLTSKQHPSLKGAGRGYLECIAVQLSPFFPRTSYLFLPPQPAVADCPPRSIWKPK